MTGAEATADKVLQKLAAAVEKDPQRQVNVTLCLPWGYLESYLATSFEFAEDVRRYLSESGEFDVAQQLADLEAELLEPAERAHYIYVRVGSRMRANGTKTVLSRVMRVRLVDVSAWNISENAG